MKRAMLSLCCVLLIAGCGESDGSSASLQREQSVTPPPQQDSSEIGDDQYAEAVPSYAGVEEEPVVPESAGANSDSSDEGVEDLLDAQGAELDCRYVGELAKEYSLISEEQDGSASIETILDTELLDNWSATAVVPEGEDKTPVLKCWARVRWSVGLESDVDLWLLIDSDSNVRVRWDNIANVVEPEGDL